MSYNTNVPNYFDSAAAAELYAKGCPDFHDAVAAQLREPLGLHENRRLENALDVGCGTGLSTRALTSIAKCVVGVDVSPDMLTQAQATEGVVYKVGSAENLPETDETFDLIVVSSAFHWFDRARFLSEAQRVLRSGGFLVLYDIAFRAVLREEPGFEDWVHGVHLIQYPSPPRSRWQPEASALPYGWVLREPMWFERDVPFTHEQLIDYLLTQSNALAVWESGRETVDQTRAFLRQETVPFFVNNPVRHAQFSGTVWLLQAIGK